MNELNMKKEIRKEFRMWTRQRGYILRRAKKNILRLEKERHDLAVEIDRIQKQMPRCLKKIDRRIAILQGRLS
jgi:hypothetical protein